MDPAHEFYMTILVLKGIVCSNAEQGDNRGGTVCYFQL